VLTTKDANMLSEKEKKKMKKKKKNGPYCGSNISSFRNEFLEFKPSLFWRQTCGH